MNKFYAEAEGVVLWNYADTHDRAYLTSLAREVIRLGEIANERGVRTIRVSRRLYSAIYERLIRELGQVTLMDNERGMGYTLLIHGEQVLIDPGLTGDAELEIDYTPRPTTNV